MASFHTEFPEVSNGMQRKILFLTRDPFLTRDLFSKRSVIDKGSSPKDPSWTLIDKGILSITKDTRLTPVFFFWRQELKLNVFMVSTLS
jgi:hypothetical protein